MTDNEIIKALECCLKGCNAEGCEDCPLYEKVEDCEIEIPIIALDLINRQKEQIKGWQEAFNNLDKIARPSVKYVKDEKAKAINEFAEKLKHKCRDSVELDDYRITVVTKSDIDSLVEEMTEGNNGDNP